MADKMTIAALQQMKRDGKKSVGVVAWDYQIARIADRAGVDFVSVGDSVGVNLWGRDEVLEVTLDEMLICCKAVRRGVERALVSCDMPYGPVQAGHRQRACRRVTPDEGRRRRHDQGRCRRRFSRCGARAGARRHSGVRAIRADAADRERNSAFPTARRIRRRRRRAPKRRTSSSPRQSCSKRPARRCSISPIPVRSPAPPSSRR